MSDFRCLKKADAARKEFEAKIDKLQTAIRAAAQ